MEIMDAIGMDSGLYSCDISNMVSVKRVTFNPVAVLITNISSMVYPTPEVLVPGTDVHMVCRATISNIPAMGARINVEVMWGREDGMTLGDHMRTSETMVLDSFSSSSKVYGSNLTFSPLMSGDGGKYVCSMRCMIGSEREWLVRYHTRILAVDSK